MVIMQNVIKIIVGAVGMLASIISMVYLLFSDRRKVLSKTADETGDSKSKITIPKSNNNFQYNTEDLGFNREDKLQNTNLLEEKSDDTTLLDDDTNLLDERRCDDTTLLSEEKSDDTTLLS